LGNPVGIKSYKPYHSIGEDFLQNYLGMIGLPMNMEPEFPAADSIILLTEEAKFDDKIVDKVKKQLTDGKTVVITSGLLRAIQDKLNDIVELRYTEKHLCKIILRARFKLFIPISRFLFLKYNISPMTLGKLFQELMEAMVGPFCMRQIIQRVIYMY
jgi:hypothetical protein